MPPPPTFSRALDSTTRNAPQTSFIPGTGASGSTPPILVSNEEILSMFTMVKDHMKRQQETNQMLMKEIQLIRTSSKRPVEDVLTPLYPRVLDFNSAATGDNHQGDLLPMQSRITIPKVTPTVRMTTPREQGYTTEPSRGCDIGNNVNTNTFATNHFDSMQDVGISP
mgnify:CR=1 FL=1